MGLHGTRFAGLCGPCAPHSCPDSPSARDASFMTGRAQTDPCVGEHQVSQGLGTQQSPQAWAGAPLLPRGDGLHTEASRPRLCPAWNSLPEFLAVAMGGFGQPGGRAKQRSSLHLQASVCPACSWLWAFSGQQSTVPVQGLCWTREGGSTGGPTCLSRCSTW